MILVGRYVSPFVRRVGVVLQTLGIPYEHKSLSTAKDVEAIKTFNPIAKVPVLVLDNGEHLVESSAIIDTLLEMSPGQTLLPASGADRRHILQHCALMTSGLDKAIQILYEPLKRPAEKVHQPFIDGLSAQVHASLVMLEALAAKNTFPGGDKARLDCLTVSVGWFFLNKMIPKVAVAADFPHLVALTARCEALPAFKACQLEA
jgi:glutathione S-transferase